MGAVIEQSFFLARIEEFQSDSGGGRLGRHIEHDSRSWNYAAEEPRGELQDVIHDRHIPILDQGNTGSCTGNAGTGACGSGSFFSLVQGLQLPSAHPKNWVGDEDDALELYHEATVNDGFNGEFPPDDTGSTGLAVAKSLQKDGFISGYTHAFSLNAALAATMKVPTIWGINWYDSFDRPDSSGLVTITKNAEVRGGHEVLCRSLAVEQRQCLFDNSWSSAWGYKGSFIVGWDDLERLLGEQGDCTAFTPNDAPAPTPTPPNEDDADTKMHKALQALNKAHKEWWAVVQP